MIESTITNTEIMYSLIRKLAMAQIDTASMDYRYYSPAKPIVRAEIKSQSTEFNKFRDKNIEE